MALQCHQIHFLWRSFRSSNLCFWQKKAVEYEIWTLFARWKEIDQFLEGLFGKQHSVLSQSLHGSSVSQNKTPVKVFWFKQFSFHTKSRNKIWNLGTFLLLERNWSNFFFRGWGWGGGWWTDLKSKIQFSSILSMALQCHKRKLLSRFFGLSNLPFRLNKEIKSQIWTLFARSKEIDQFFLGGGLYGKQHSVLSQSLHGSSVSQNKTPVMVFWFNQFSFHTKESNKISNLDPFHQVKRNWPIFGRLIWKAAFSVMPKFAWLFSVSVTK